MSAVLELASDKRVLTLFFVLILVFCWHEVRVVRKTGRENERETGGGKVIAMVQARDRAREAAVLPRTLIYSRELQVYL